MSNTQQIEAVKDESIISIKLSGSFYKRIQAVMLHLSEYRESEDLSELIDKINTGSDDEYDEWETAMETMMILCSEVETKAKEQNATEMVDISANKEEESTN